MTRHVSPSSIVSTLEDSPIIDVLRIGQEVEDIIPLWLGESCFATDGMISNAASAALQSGRTFYTPNRGIPELRESIRRYYQRIYGVSVEDRSVSVTNSGMHAVSMIARAAMDAGDNAILITPCWPNVDRAIRLVGGEIREVPLDMQDGAFELDMAKLNAQIDAKTKLIYLASPSNPTGWTIGEKQARELLELSRKTGAAVLSDEVYQRLSFDSEMGSTLLSFAEPDDALFVVNSFSKAWSMTGWRLGWMIYPLDFHDSFEKLSQFTISGSPGFVQMAGVQALDHGDALVAEMRAHCIEAKSYVEERLVTLPEVSVIPSMGGFYTMFTAPQTSDSTAFCKKVARSARVGFAPGAAFGAGGEGLVRLCFARKKETLDTALTRLAAFLSP
ncbi:aminotransferase class I/II-fold pyridoxal phosphate-dependent enzyme [Ruegeria sp. 2012CJ41-6]|uniref:Aminotransferase n=1 Tax=Ruegeria spongiae TaxID=2942209 RepID=A0ABT0Q766_9RHOB|nr:aminotransferase class I/II-fold pyridoxal phosphate-dependent enzyme [Ruegeria spongiae]MCL6285678.1 aminotransferase class I/II-fold pyridoxal phosphate-dependent enzyme [Ruegeria spongiae]